MRRARPHQRNYSMRDAVLGIAQAGGAVIPRGVALFLLHKDVVPVMSRKKNWCEQPRLQVQQAGNRNTFDSLTLVGIYLQCTTRLDQGAMAFRLNCEGKHLL